MMNSNLDATTAVLQSGINQLKWEIEEEEHAATLESCLTRTDVPPCPNIFEAFSQPDNSNIVASQAASVLKGIAVPRGGLMTSRTSINVAIP
jgi:hypothetical protein